jgi:hypothetical protein
MAMTTMEGDALTVTEMPKITLENTLDGLPLSSEANKLGD